MCSSNMSGNLKYCNIRIWSWQRLELNSVWEKQAAKKLSCLFHVSPPQKKPNPAFPHKQLKTKTPNVQGSDFIGSLGARSPSSRQWLCRVSPRTQRCPRSLWSQQDHARRAWGRRAPAAVLSPFLPPFTPGVGISALGRAWQSTHPWAPHGPFPACAALPVRPGPSPAPRSAASRRWRAGPPREPRTSWWHLCNPPRSAPGRSCPSGGVGAGTRGRGSEAEAMAGGSGRA